MAPPTGTITFLFTDIEGSAQRWDAQPEAMKGALARHDAVLREAIEQHNGYVFKTMGDAFHAAFATAQEALRAAVEGQRALAAEGWGTAVRMALHTGTADERDGDYFGPTLNRMERLRAGAHGGQIVLSAVTAGLLRGQLPDGVELRELGVYRLRGLSEPERVHQAAIWGLPADFPPLALAEDHPSTLPVPVTSLVGREEEIEQIVSLLGSTRLLTLTGPGGVGKTQLAIAVTVHVREHYPDGMVFVDLSPVADPALVTSSIAQACGVRESEGRPLADVLRAYLRAKRLLLLLDNFEQVVEAAPMLRDLLAASTDLALLVTSRVALRLSGEQEYSVSPLPVPDIAITPGVSALGAVPSVALFLQRARQARPDFALTDANARAVADVCARLDGLPLAIELAAARIRVLSPDAIRARLAERFAILVGGARDAPARQRTMRAAIAWSYDLLVPEEQQLFTRLAIFVGGCTVEAVAAICDISGDLDGRELDGLASLAEHSLILRQDRSDGAPRFTMLETIRAFGLERLAASPEFEDLPRRHAHYFLEVAEHAKQGSAVGDQPAWLSRLESDHDNVRSALDWFLTRRAADEAQRMAAALGWFWTVRSHWTERAAPGLSAHSRSTERRSVRARACLELGVVLRDSDDVPVARAYVEESLALYRELGDDLGIGRALLLLGDVVQILEGNAAARPLYDDSLTVLEQVGDDIWIAQTLNRLGHLAVAEGDDERARRLYEDSLARQRSRRDAWSMGWTLVYLGRLALRGGDLEAARSRLEESRALFRRTGDAGGEARVLNLLGAVAARSAQDRSEAKALMEEAARLYRQLADDQGVATALNNLGWLALAEGDRGRAASLFQELVTLGRGFANRSGLIYGIAGLASVAALDGQPGRAARLFGATDALRAEHDLRLAPGEEQRVRPYIATARAALGEDAFAAAYAEGRALSLGDAVALALEQADELAQAPSREA